MEAERPADTWTVVIFKASVIVIAILVGTYLLLVLGRAIKPGCFAFTATCPPGLPDAIEACVSAQYVAACPLWSRLIWLVVWAGYCYGVVWLVKRKWPQKAVITSS